MHLTARSIIRFLFVLAALSCGLPTAQAAVPPAGGTSIVAPNLSLDVPNQAGKVASALVAVSGQAFTQALKVQTLATQANPWDIQVNFNTTGAFSRGDTLLLTFSMRVDAAPGLGSVQFWLQHSSGDYEKAVYASERAAAGSGWAVYQVGFSVPTWMSQASYSAGQATLGFGFGFAAQTVEIGGISLVNYGTSVAVTDLPYAHYPYDGQAADAPWRAQAQARIQDQRMAPLAVTVTDAGGLPVAGATVHVRMLRHAFPFGTAVTQCVDNPVGDNKTYQDTILANFNAVGVENALKWQDWDGSKSWNHSDVLATLKWMKDHHLPVRGHNLVWPKWQWMPAYVQNDQNDLAKLKQDVLDHIADEAGTVGSQVEDWDVVNEPYANHDLQDLLGQGCLTDFFKAARSAAPNARLYLNDYPNTIGAHADSFVTLAQDLLAAHAPLDGLGVQGHISADPVGIPAILALLNRLGSVGLPLRITEFDHETRDEALQAQYLTDFYTAAFSHPQVIGIQMWGFWESRHWLPKAALWRADWSIKPNGQAYRDLIYKTWWTDVTLSTDVNGQAQVRGYLGDYELVCNAPGTAVTTRTLTLTRSTPAVTIVAAIKPGDANRDGSINSNDLKMVQEHMGQTSADSGWDARVDLDGDGRVYATDLGIVTRNQGR